MNLYLLKKTPSKARRDTDRIMEEMGFRNIGFTPSTSDSKVVDFFVTLGGVLLKAPRLIQQGDTLLLPYNLRKYYIFLCNLAHRRGARVVTLIHDLSSFYRKKITPREEIARLNHSDYIIAHNPVMKEWLLTNGCTAPVGVLGLFDFLSSGKPAEKELPEKPYTVLYAGTLSPAKNGFLYELESRISNYRLHVYGKGLDHERIRNRDRFIYKGFASPDELIASADSDFGLVWDGNAIDLCDGPRGQYMKYNNPHKFSLYMRCGLPVVIWEEAALARFVRENGVGICISSLAELDDALSAVTPEQYREMKQQVVSVSQRLAEGYYFKRAFREATETIGD